MVSTEESNANTSPRVFPALCLCGSRPSCSVSNRNGNAARENHSENNVSTRKEQRVTGRRGSDGKYTLAAVNNQSDRTALKDVLAEGFWKSVTIGDLTDESQAWGKKAQEDYNALVDKYNAALALLKQSNELASQEQAFIQQMRANTAASQAAERQARINNALLIYGMMQHQTYTPPQVFYNLPAWQPSPRINCTSTSTALVPGMVNTDTTYQ